MKKIVIGVTGMPGAGKNVVHQIANKLGFPVIVMGDEVRTEAERRKLKPTPENLGMLMLQIRAEKGPDVLAKMCILKIEALDSPIVVVDGIRSLQEVKEFKKAFPIFRIIAIHASPMTRFKRLLNRGRSDDPKDLKTLIGRDERELSVGIGEVIALADYMIINEGTKGNLWRQTTCILRMVMKNEQNG